MEKWLPTTAYGALTAASFTGTGLEPLSGYAEKIFIPRGIHLVPRGFGRDPAGGDDHAKAVGHRLTAAPTADTSERYAKGMSLDHVDRAVDQSGRQGAAEPDGRLPRERRARQLLVYGTEQQAIPFQDPWKAFKDWAGAGAPTSMGGAMMDRAGDAA